MAKNFKNTIAQATQTTQEPQKVEEGQEPANARTTQGRKGEKLQRMNCSFTPEVFDYIKSMSKAQGLSYSAFIEKELQRRRAEHEELDKAYNNIVALREI